MTSEWSFEMRYLPMEHLPSPRQLLQNCPPRVSQSTTPMGRKPTAVGVKDPGWQGERWRGRKHLGDPWFRVSLGGGKCMENVVINLCVGCTCCLVVSQVKVVVCCWCCVVSMLFLPHFCSWNANNCDLYAFSHDTCFSWKKMFVFGWICVFFPGFPTGNVEYNQNLGGGNSNIFYDHPENWGRWTHFDEHIFQMGWFNHQLENPVQPFLV